MIDLDPELVLKSPWLWDEMTLEWARKAVEQRRESGKSSSEGESP